MSEPTSKRLDRRTFVTLLGATGTIAIAGCTDDGEDPQDAPEEGGPQEDTPQGGSSDGGDSQGETPGSGADEQETPGADESGTDEQNESDGTDSPSDEDGTTSGDDTTGADETYELQVSATDSAGEPIEGASVAVEAEDGTSATEEPCSGR
jgi:hypothetical protein